MSGWRGGRGLGEGAGWPTLYDVSRVGARLIGRHIAPCLAGARAARGRDDQPTRDPVIQAVSLNSPEDARNSKVA